MQLVAHAVSKFDPVPLEIATLTVLASLGFTLLEFYIQIPFEFAAFYDNVIFKVLHEPPWYGTVCPVVWEDGGSNPASYPVVFF